MPVSVRWFDDEPDDLSDAGKDRFFIIWGDLCGALSAGLGKAAGDGGLMYGG